MKKLLMVAVSAFALSFAGNVYANGLDIDADLLSGNKNDDNKGSVVGNDNDDNKVNSDNKDESEHANGNKVDEGNGVAGNDNDNNYITDVNIDDIDVTIKIDASKRVASSKAVMGGVVAGNKLNNGGLNVNLGLLAKQSAGNSIKTGGIGQTGGFDAGINVQQAATGFNNLNQAQVQVSAQASFNGE
jgi:hypothetical protein